MAKIVGPGSLNVDITGYAKRLPVGGETMFGEDVRMGPGGKGGNQMCAAHRAGAEVVMVSRIGTDALAHVITEHYASEGMSTARITVSETAPTGSAIILVETETAQNRIIVVAGANEEVGAADVEAAEEDFASADAILAQLETGMSSVEAAKAMAVKYGKPFILNPAPYKPVDPSLFDGVDYLTPNETEAEFYTGITVNSVEDARRAAEKLLAMGVKRAIITMGSRGSYYFDGENELHIPVIPVKAVDSTGAGDAFNGGLATAVAEGMSPMDAMRFATCVATLSVTKEGAASSMPTRAEVLELFKKTFG
jgi:ribokinase